MALAWVKHCLLAWFGQFGGSLMLFWEWTSHIDTVKLHQTISVFDFTSTQLPLLLSQAEPNTHTGKKLWRSGFVITPVQFNWWDKSVTLSVVETDSPQICLFGWSALDRRVNVFFFSFVPSRLFSFTATMQMQSLQVCTVRLHVPFSCVGHWNLSRK